MNKFAKIIEYAVAVCDAEERWITVGGGTNAETGQGTGRHFKIDGEGRILAGGSAEMKGKTLKEAFSEPKTERQKIGRKFAEAGAKKFGGDERQYRNLGTKKGQADSFAREYLKSGNVPEGHLKEALVDKPADNAAANGGQNSKSAIQNWQDKLNKLGNVNKPAENSLKNFTQYLPRYLVDTELQNLEMYERKAKDANDPNQKHWERTAKNTREQLAYAAQRGQWLKEGGDIEFKDWILKHPIDYTGDVYG